ncbi:serine hydrolase [Roseomonas sp. CCTCC AB2023176]|uniref:serine hydrolase n=1 Tax=Roseomonas sp. CCTCC AB2023176 TaxID=3342640 RepID=UPI0035DF9A16
MPRPPDAPPETHAALRRLFAGGPVPEAWFAPAFLSAFPAGGVEAIVARLLRDHGPAGEITGDAAEPTVHLARAEVPVTIRLDPAGRIAGILFRSAVPRGGLEEQVLAIAALPGRSALLVTTGEAVRAAHAPDAVLAVGSAFKLALLRAVRDAVRAGRIAWDTVLHLDPALRSLPSGILQDWPDGAPVTVATLANLAISLSDNTATDALIHLVGRDALEALSPHDRPFPTTREFFALRDPGNAALLREWTAAGPEARLALLPRLAPLPLPKPPPDLIVDADIGWFASAEDLLGHLRAVADLPAPCINPGPVERGPWRRVAYKGGSLPGVLCLAALLTGQDGRQHGLVATWNDAEALEADRLIGPFRAIAALLAAEDRATEDGAAVDG